MPTSEPLRKDAPQTGRWLAKPRKPRWGIQHVAFIGLYFQVAAHLPKLVKLVTGQAWVSLLAETLFLLPFLLGVAWTISSEIAARRIAAADLAMVDGGFGDQFPAELTIIVEGRRIGTDRGVAWFADGLMGFSGASASFVLGASDLAPQWIVHRRQPLGKSVAGNAMVLLGAPKVAAAVVIPLFGHSKAYHKRIAAFFDHDEAPRGDRHWPPLEGYEATPALVRGEA